MSGSSERRSSAGRRRFLKLVGMAGLSSAIVSTLEAWSANRPTKPKPVTSPRPPADHVAPPRRGGEEAAVRPEPEVSDDARALASILERRYGEHLTPEQLEVVTREIENRLRGGERLRASKLANHEEPDFIFKV